MPEADIPERLRKVLPLVCEGHRNKQIADELSLEEHTVENYVSDLLAHFGVGNRTELAAVAWRLGLWSG